METPTNGGAALWKREVSRLIAWALLLLVVLLYPLLLLVFTLIAWFGRGFGGRSRDGQGVSGGRI